MIKTITRGRQRWTLCRRSNLAQALNYITWTQTVTNTFRNVMTREYHGNKWNPEKVLWIVEG